MSTRSYRHLALATTLGIAGAACGPSTPPLAPTPETLAPPESPPVAPEPALAPPALSAAALREAVAQAGSGGAAFMALAGHPGIVSVTIAQDGTKSARCTSGLTVNPLEEYWKCDADLLRCTADRPELGAVWRFRAGPDGARLVDGEIVDWAPARPIPEGDDIGAALAGRDELCGVLDLLETHAPTLIGGAIDVATLAGDGTPTRRTLCGNDAVALAHELVGRSGWACEGLECRMRDSVADPELHVGAAFDAGQVMRLTTVLLSQLPHDPAHEADSAAKIKGMLMAAPGRPCAAAEAVVAPGLADALDAYRRFRAADPSAAAAALTPTLACFEGKPDVAAEAALTALAKRPPRAAGPIRVVRASADEVLLAEFGTLERDGAPKLDPIDVLVRRGADGWRVAGLSGPTGKACWKEAGAVHADPPWRAAVCLDAAKAAWKDSHPCKDPLRLCQQAEGGIEQSLRDCLAP